MTKNQLVIARVKTDFLQCTSSGKTLVTYNQHSSKTFSMRWTENHLDVRLQSSYMNRHAAACLVSLFFTLEAYPPLGAEAFTDHLYVTWTVTKLCQADPRIQIYPDS